MPFVWGERIWRRAIVLLSALSHFDGHKLTKAHLVFLLPSASIWRVVWVNELYGQSRHGSWCANGGRIPLGHMATPLENQDCCLLFSPIKHWFLLGECYLNSVRNHCSVSCPMELRLPSRELMSTQHSAVNCSLQSFNIPIWSGYLGGAFMRKKGF